jgi:hypothetical protein
MVMVMERRTGAVPVPILHSIILAITWRCLLQLQRVPVRTRLQKPGCKSALSYKTAVRRFKFQKRNGHLDPVRILATYGLNTNG